MLRLYLFSCCKWSLKRLFVLFFKLFCWFSFVFFAIFVSINKISSEQMKNTAAMLRNVCQPKSKLSDGNDNFGPNSTTIINGKRFRFFFHFHADVIDKMRDRIFPTDKPAKVSPFECELFCVYLTKLNWIYFVLIEQSNSVLFSVSSRTWEW